MPATTPNKVSQLRKLLDGASTMLIVLQDSPDPDALGAAVGLRKMANQFTNVQCSISCGGHVGRAENRAMVRYLNLNLRPMSSIQPERFDLIAMVDTQPGTGNNSLPDNVSVDICIDHHPVRRETRSLPFNDVRSKYGATSTILFEYLQEAKIAPSPPLATALLFGIRSDTQDLGREATAADTRAYEALYPLANKRILGAIQLGQVPSEYYRMLGVALQSAILCGKCIYSHLGVVNNPDMMAEVADLLLRHEDVDWSMCWGFYEDKALISIRGSEPDNRADGVIKKIVARKGTGGGHNTMAGGQIPVTEQDYHRLNDLIIRRFLKSTGNDSCTARSLV